MSEESQNLSNEPFPEGPADDPLAFDEAPPSAINRPASGARQAMPGEILSMDFRGAETAGDFLGLDTEFTEASIDPTAGEVVGGDGLDLAHAPLSGQSAAAEDASLSDVMEPDVYQEEEYAEEEYDDEYEEGEFDEYAGEPGEYDEVGEYDGEGEFLDDSFEDEGVASSGGRAKLLIGSVLAVGLLTAAAVTLVPRFLSDDSGAGTNVARGPITKGPVTPVVEPTTTVETTPDTPEVDPLTVDTNIDPLAEGGETVEAPNIEDFITPDTPDTLAGGTETDPFDLGVLTGTDSGAAEDPITDMTNQISQIFGMQPQGGDESFPDFAQGFEWVSEDMLDMIWRGSDVPMEAISAPARTLMPHVGMVMVHMTTGEVFEGRLYAVGQDRVWIDARPGRIGLEGASVERIASLAIADVNLIASNTPAPTGKRVRAKVPGGWLYGRVLAENGNMITLISDDGAKVTLDDPEIESLGSSRAIIIHR